MPHLFSYGTLQQADVQLALFGKKLNGHADELTGFERAVVTIDDPRVIETSGSSHHPIIRYRGRASDRVAGTVFQITDEDLARADRYESAAYTRVAVTLASGLFAWVYVDAAHSLAALPATPTESDEHSPPAGTGECSR
jgi:hypothetical protein